MSGEYWTHDQECSLGHLCPRCEDAEEARRLAEDEESALGIDEGTVDVEAEDMDGGTWRATVPLRPR